MTLQSSCEKFLSLHLDKECKQSSGAKIIYYQRNATIYSILWSWIVMYVQGPESIDGEYHLLSIVCIHSILRYTKIAFN